MKAWRTATALPSRCLQSTDLSRPSWSSSPQTHLMTPLVVFAFSHQRCSCQWNLQKKKDTLKKKSFYFDKFMGIPQCSYVSNSSNMVLHQKCRQTHCSVRFNHLESNLSAFCWSIVKGIFIVTRRKIEVYF